jgi:hypothetical protein
MPEINLTQAQIRTIALIAEDTKDKGWLTLVSPPEGDLFDRSYVEVRVYGVEGDLVDTEILTYAGVRPQAEVPPEWGASKD